MDMKALRKEAMEAATRFFLEKRDFLPSEDSEEWEDEYRRQLDLAKKRQASARPADAAPREESPAEGPELSGAPAQQRWAATLRAERLTQIQSKEIRDWIVGAWTAANSSLYTSRIAAMLL